ncbi:hypothetical protein OH492_21060 [Vibrio chagasii]|nr:hypothetical protein [Vibrio chagasii]
MPWYFCLRWRWWCCQFPAFFADMFFTFNIALAMVVLLVSVYTREDL